MEVGERMNTQGCVCVCECLKGELCLYPLLYTIQTTKMYLLSASGHKHYVTIENRGRDQPEAGLEFQVFFMCPRRISTQPREAQPKKLCVHECGIHISGSDKKINENNVGSIIGICQQLVLIEDLGQDGIIAINSKCLLCT